MARPRLTHIRRRVRLDGYVPVDVNESDDELLRWLDSLPPRTKFPTVWNMLKVGSAVTLNVQAGDTNAAIEAARDLIDAFVVE